MSFHHSQRLWNDYKIQTTKFAIICIIFFLSGIFTYSAYQKSERRHEQRIPGQGNTPNLCGDTTCPQVHCSMSNQSQCATYQTQQDCEFSCEKCDYTYKLIAYQENHKIVHNSVYFCPLGLSKIKRFDLYQLNQSLWWICFAFLIVVLILTITSIQKQSIQTKRQNLINVNV